jgi:hypothetical protein
MKGRRTTQVREHAHAEGSAEPGKEEQTDAEKKKKKEEKKALKK